MGKITKAMKMVAAAKMRRDTERLMSGVPFCDPVISFMGNLPADERPVPKMFVGVGGDKGLCGGVNSSIVKNIRLNINSVESSGGQAQVFVLGQKPTAGLKRLYGDRFVYGVDGAQGVDWCEPERVSFVYNHMKSAIAFETQCVDAISKKGYQSLDKLELSKAVDQVSFEPDRVECWDDLHEFYYGATMFKGMLDSQASEQSSRMNAMENASKNAGAMLDALTLKYNRARKAKITTELCEIISGASAL